MVAATDLKMILSDMGYGLVEEPKMADYFETIVREADMKNVGFPKKKTTTNREAV